MTRYPTAGLALNVEELGTPLVLLHGFTGSSRAFAGLRWGRRAIAVDLVGHGASDRPHDPEPYRAENQVAQLLALFDRLELAEIDLLGYSMGGRVAMQLAAASPDRIRRLVLESASPGIVDAAERAARVESDEKLAQLAEAGPIELFVDRWERVPLFASQARLPAEVRARVRTLRLANDPRAVAASLRGFGAGVPDPLWGRLPDQPTLVIVGALDEKYRAIGRAMAERMPNARMVVVPEAGHTVHLEQPTAYERLVLDFLGE